jgi:hypothetical protein
MRKEMDLTREERLNAQERRDLFYRRGDILILQVGLGISDKKIIPRKTE